MHESGLRSIEVGKASGLWNFMDDVDLPEIPEDLRWMPSPVPLRFRRDQRLEQAPCGG